MKRDFLKQLGIEDKEIIDKILDENSSDIGRAKGDLDDKVTKLTEANQKLSAMETELNSLKTAAGDVDKLTTKITELTNENTTLKSTYETKIQAMSLDNAIESALRDSKAKNVKAVKALLNLQELKLENDGLTGLDEQLTKLKEDASTAFLFDDGKPPAPVGTQPAGGNNNSPTGSLSFADAIAGALQTTK